MESLYIMAAEQTAKIEFKLNDNLKMLGVSIPENSFNFYNKVVDWIELYQKTSFPKKINLVLNLECFNIASSEK